MPDLNTLQYNRVMIITIISTAKVVFKCDYVMVKKIWNCFYAPRHKVGEACSFARVPTYVLPSITRCSVVCVSATPHTVFDGGFETCNTV